MSNSCHPVQFQAATGFRCSDSKGLVFTEGPASLATGSTDADSRSCSEGAEQQGSQSEGSIGGGMCWADMESDDEDLSFDFESAPAASTTECSSLPSEVAAVEHSPAARYSCRRWQQTKPSELASAPVAEGSSEVRPRRTSLNIAAKPYLAQKSAVVEPAAPQLPSEASCPAVWWQGDAWQDDAWQAGATVMLCRLPLTYTRADFLELLDSRGFRGSFDYVYLPMNMKAMTNVGYAFLNLTSEAEANRFFDVFNGFNEWSCPFDGSAVVTWGHVQGFWENVNRYRNSPIMTENVPECCKPMVFKDGWQVEFPKPTMDGVRKFRNKRLPPACRVRGDL